MGINDKIRRDILARHGLANTPITQMDRVRKKKDNKTLVMRQIEERFGLPIEELLMRGTEKEVGDALGVDFTTVSIWRLRLGLRSQNGRPAESGVISQQPVTDAPGDTVSGGTT